MFKEKYNPQKIEKKWQKMWSDAKTNKTGEDMERPKHYCLDMFPYPSGSGLHVGHWRGYVLSDVWSRFMRMKGYNVLHPMGWDAFGLPAENAAIEKKAQPRKWTLENIQAMKDQFAPLGLSFDWSKEVTTCEPDYTRDEAFQKAYASAAKEDFAAFKQRFLSGDEANYQAEVAQFATEQQS